MSWKWEYALGAEEAARAAPADFLAAVSHRADELVRAAEALHVHGRAYEGIDPKGREIIVSGGWFRYQVVVRSERVYIVQITYLGF
ncbi:MULTISPECIES: hypothetical protein [Streptomyces]|uniref:Type II toxin-antitoxin system RelE/ParE family toxin n=1 Tax=Streptomyces dengpaensis TaxID=2049881 RepID=A0ABN5HZX4_9ACTN|nr:MULTISPECIES: hypothetical protein [Streptomyces]AVH56696.1 hypothetical protein C4B68_13945 [Streptomyces dengpaensis]PIB10278.1 hypothetical protein B1C81_07195 [Streptomyces sp. HG99]